MDGLVGGWVGGKLYLPRVNLRRARQRSSRTRARREGQEEKEEPVVSRASLVGVGGWVGEWLWWVFSCGWLCWVGGWVVLSPLTG